MNGEWGDTPINGRRVAYRVELYDVWGLQYWEDNPRVYGALTRVSGWKEADSAERQRMIGKRMIKEASTRQVLGGLREHGGQQEPLLVDGGDMTVIEGNSRLAAMRELMKEDPKNFEMAECHVYDDLSQEEKCALVAEQHINGKVEWGPYAKAMTYWRQKHEWKWDIAKIARYNRSSVPSVTHDIETVELMLSQGEPNHRKFSWYSVLRKTKEIRAEMDSNPKFKERVQEIVKMAGTGEEEERAAGSFRDKLKAVVGKPKVLKKFTAGRQSLEECADEAKISSPIVRLKKARSELEMIDRGLWLKMEQREQSEAKLLLKRLCQRAGKLEELLTEGNSGRSKA